MIYDIYNHIISLFNKSKYDYNSKINKYNFNEKLLFYTIFFTDDYNSDFFLKNNINNLFNKSIKDNIVFYERKFNNNYNFNNINYNEYLLIPSTILNLDDIKNKNIFDIDLSYYISQESIKYLFLLDFLSNLYEYYFTNYDNNNEFKILTKFYIEDNVWKVSDKYRYIKFKIFKNDFIVSNKADFDLFDTFKNDIYYHFNLINKDLFLTKESRVYALYISKFYNLMKMYFNYFLLKSMEEVFPKLPDEITHNTRLQIYPKYFIDNYYNAIYNNYSNDFLNLDINNINNNNYYKVNNNYYYKKITNNNNVVSNIKLKEWIVLIVFTIILLFILLLLIFEVNKNKTRPVSVLLLLIVCTIYIILYFIRNNENFYTEPSTAEPSTAEPSTAEPSTTEPSTAEPSTTEPSATEPSATEPSTTEPSTTEPSTTEPSATEPSATEPSATEPSATEPSTTEPSTSSGGETLANANLTHSHEYTFAGNTYNVSHNHEYPHPHVLSHSSQDILSYSNTSPIIRNNTTTIGTSGELLDNESLEQQYNTNNPEITSEVLFNLLGNAFKKSFPNNQESDMTLLNNDMIAWYKFNGNFKDSSQNNNNLNVIKDTNGSYRFENIKNSNEFNELYLEKVMLKASDINLSNRDFTFSAWIYKTDYEKSCVIMTQGREITNTFNKGFIIGFLRNNAMNKSNSLYVYLPCTDVNNNIVIYNQENVDDSNKWVHWTISYSKDTYYVKIYKNSQLVLTQQSQCDNLTIDDNNLYIGNITNNNRLSFENSLSGKIRDVRIYNKQLSNIDVINLYNYKDINSVNGSGINNSISNLTNELIKNFKLYIYAVDKKNNNNTNLLENNINEIINIDNSFINLITILMWLMTLTFLIYGFIPDILNVFLLIIIIILIISTFILYYMDKL